MIPLYIAIGLLVVATFTMPIEQLPHTRGASFRALLGALLFVASGVCLGAYIKW
jgi:nitric oxide reductase large subunit